MCDALAFHRRRGNTDQKNPVKLVYIIAVFYVSCHDNCCIVGHYGWKLAVVTSLVIFTVTTYVLSVYQYALSHLNELIHSL